ncbi:hypothetical protein JXB28_03230 [Candidatus Woesearchaeota archaeon]|nr:hypothetical protein [Candidatus Woesearchaeota archaeon]
MYETIKKTYFESIFDTTALEENLQMIAYSLVSFFVTFLIGHPQLAVGIAVNAALILGATYLKGHKLLPIILLPSLGVLARGLIFGPFTMLLIYMIPFIWLSNALFAYGFKYLMRRKLEKKNQVANVVMPILPAAIKTAFLFTSALILVKLAVLPTIFLTTMGILQLVTALAGGTIAVGIIKAKEAVLK